MTQFDLFLDEDYNHNFFYISNVPSQIFFITLVLFVSNQLHYFVAERTSYFCLAQKFIWPLWSSYIFTQGRWLILFCPDHFFPGNIKMTKDRQTFSSSESLERDGRLSLRSLPSSRITTPWGEPSSLWTLESILLDQRFPVKHILDVIILPPTGTLLCRL